MDPLTLILGDPVALSLLKGEGIEPFWQGQQAKGLIDQQDVGVCVEFTMIMVSKYYPRSLAAGKTAPQG